MKKKTIYWIVAIIIILIAYWNCSGKGHSNEKSKACSKKETGEPSVQGVQSICETWTINPCHIFRMLGLIKCRDISCFQT